MLNVAAPTRLMIMFVPIAGIITAPLSGWIITILDWRWLFIIEGLLSVVVLALWVYTVYDRPQEARWISEAESATWSIPSPPNNAPSPEPPSKMRLSALYWPTEPCGN